MKIKRCPFCGRRAQLIQNYNKKLDAYFVYVECEVCGAKGKASSSKEDLEHANLEENKACNRAVSSWNNRVPINLLKILSNLHLREPIYGRNYIPMDDLNYIIENIYDEDKEDIERLYKCL